MNPERFSVCTKKGAAKQKLECIVKPRGMTGRNVGGEKKGAPGKRGGGDRKSRRGSAM